MSSKNDGFESIRNTLRKQEMQSNKEKNLLIKLMEKNNFKIGQKVTIMDEKTKWIDKIEIVNFEGDLEGDFNLIKVGYITDRSHVLKSITVSDLLQNKNYFKEYKSNRPTRTQTTKSNSIVKDLNKNPMNYQEFLKSAEINRIKWFGHPGISTDINKLQPYNMGFLENGLYLHLKNVLLSKAKDTFARSPEKIWVKDKHFYSYSLSGGSGFVLYKKRVNSRTHKKEAYDVISLEYFLKTAPLKTIDEFFEKQEEISEELAKFLDYTHLQGYIKKQKSVSDDLIEKYLHNLTPKDILEKKEVFKEVERILNADNFLLRSPNIPFDFNEEQRFKIPFMLHILYLEQSLPDNYKSSFYRHGKEVIHLYKEAAERVKREQFQFNFIKKLVEEKKMIVITEAIVLGFIQDIKIVSESIGKIEVQEEN